MNDDWIVSDDILKLIKKLKKHNVQFALGIQAGDILECYVNGTQPEIFNLLGNMGFIVERKWENIEQANVLLNLKEAQNESHD